MPPLDMSIKAAFHTPFPLHSTVHRKVPNHMGSTGPTTSCFEPRACTTWSKNTYFPFTHPPQPMTVNPPPIRRQVQFLELVTVYDVLHIHDYSKQELTNTWYSKREIRAMKQKCKEEATQVTTNMHSYENEPLTIPDQEPLSDTTNTYQEPTTTVRGLESKTSFGSLRKKRHRIQAWTAVFMEQRRQLMEGFSDPESLADAYFEVSEPCHVVANMVALRDARDVQFMDEWDTKAELEKENQRGIRTSESSGELQTTSRRYQRLMTLQSRSQRQFPVVVVAAA